MRVDADDEARAVLLLKAGQVVALPTETVYGLAADATSERAVKKIFETKGRPSDHPLIVHFADWSSCERWAPDLSVHGKSLARAFWPGPMTLVMPRAPTISLAATGGLETMAVRVVLHEKTQRVLRGFGCPVAMPSANPFGKVSPTTADHVRRDLPNVFVVDGGSCAVGLESTIVDVSGDQPRILRPGGITPEALATVLGFEIKVAERVDLPVPGSLASHYSPNAVLRLTSREELGAVVARTVAAGHRVGVLDFFCAPLPEEAVVERLKPEVAAQGLYAALRRLDDAGVELIFSALPDETELGLALADRLTRAAEPG